MMIEEEEKIDWIKRNTPEIIEVLFTNKGYSFYEFTRLMKEYLKTVTLEIRKDGIFVLETDFYYVINYLLVDYEAELELEGSEWYKVKEIEGEDLLVRELGNKLRLEGYNSNPYYSEGEKVFQLEFDALESETHEESHQASWYEMKDLKKFVMRKPYMRDGKVFIKFGSEKPLSISYNLGNSKIELILGPANIPS